MVNNTEEAEMDKLCRRYWSKLNYKNFLVFASAVLFIATFVLNGSRHYHSQRDVLKPCRGPNCRGQAGRRAASNEQKQVVQKPVQITQNPMLIPEVHRGDASGPPNTVVLTTTNAAFLDFTANWLASISRSGVWPDITIIAEDDTAYQTLRRRNDIRVMMTDFDKTQSSKLTFDTPLYKRFVNQRPTYIQKFLKLGLNVLFSDVDIVWMGNPFEYFDGDYDIYLEEDQHDPYIAYCAGFVYYRATEHAIKLVDEIIYRIDQNKSETADQVILNEIITQKQMPELRVKTLGSDRFPNGKYYWHPNWKAWRERQVNKPVVIHNNWIVSRDQKRERFKKAGLWFAPNATDYGL